jgi:hypothetical protein
LQKAFDQEIGDETRYAEGQPQEKDPGAEAACVRFSR